jgi:hypothetical protein
MKLWSNENPLVLEVYLNPITKCWEAKSVKSSDGYGDLPEINLDALAMLDDPDLGLTVSKRLDTFLSSPEEQQRLDGQLADIRRIMWSD